MKITAIRAHAVLLKVELDITSPAKTPSHQACVVEIETDAGITGHGSPRSARRRQSARLCLMSPRRPLSAWTR